MTAQLDLHPDTGHPSLACVQEIHEALDRAGHAHRPLPSGEYAALVGECQRAISRLEGLKLRLIADADRAQVASLSAMSGTEAWAAKQTRTSPRETAKAVRLAGALADGHEATRTALAGGDLTPEHAHVIVDATRRLPASLAPSQVAQVERTLVAKARTVDPVDLRRAARRALEVVERDRARVDAHEDALLRDEEAAALARTRFWVRDNGDGTMTGGFTVPRLAGSILSKTIQQLASPRRSRWGATTAQAGPVGGDIDWAHRHGESFVELLEHLPTDRLHGKVAATVLVTVEHAKLIDAVGAAGLDDGEQLSAGEARRMACGAGILPAVLGGASQVLDLGRSQRFFTEAQRVAGAVHHQTCAADGCDRPYSWCELHHREPWHRGGSTDQANLVPLCGFHHRRIHDPGYHHRARSGGGITFHRRT